VVDYVADMSWMVMMMMMTMCRNFIGVRQKHVNSVSLLKVVT